VGPTGSRLISVKVDWHDSKKAGSIKVAALILNLRILLLFTNAGYELLGCTVQSLSSRSSFFKGE
jgi:hypothetical protein